MASTRLAFNARDAREGGTVYALHGMVVQCIVVHASSAYEMELSVYYIAQEQSEQR